MDRDARRFANGHQAWHDHIGIAAFLDDDFTMKIRRNAAHVVMRGGQHRELAAG